MYANVLALPPVFSKYILLVSYLSACTALLAVYMQLYDLCFVPFLVFATSINYWRWPDYSYRRYVDIAVVQLGIWYQSVRAQQAPEPYRTLFYSTLFCACLCFAPAMYFVERPPNHDWQKFLDSSVRVHRRLAISTLFHVLCHVLGNVSNCILYVSDVPRIL